MANKRKIYEIIIAFLAMVSIALTTLDFSKVINISSYPWSSIDSSILIIFTIDYFSRLYLSKNKFHFFKSNIFDLLAIIPFGSMFSLFRFSRVFRVFRLLKIFKFVRLIGFVGKVQKNFKRFYRINSFIYLVWVCLAIMLVAATLYSISESVPWGEALWWAIVTSTTVGYGDISPHTIIGKVSAVLLMFVGVGFIGILTSTITAYFSSDNQSKDDDKDRFGAIYKKLTELEQQNRQLMIEIKKTKKDNKDDM